MSRLPQTLTMREAHERVATFLAAGRRYILGLTGPPGAGKSTLARELNARFGDASVIVPMDGFHLANAELARLGRAGRKGSEDTFDCGGYAAILRRLHEQKPGEIVYAPEFHRELEESIAGAIAVYPEHSLILTEGNYLLLDSGKWSELRAIIDQIWYIDVDPVVRVERLIARHVHFGRSADAAREWVMRSDERNAASIALTRSRADAIVHVV